MQHSGVSAAMSQQRELCDAEAVRAVLNGKRDAFAVLVRRHLPVVQALAVARTSNFADAEDVTQESFLRAFKYLDTLEDGNRFGAWVAAISANAARKVLAQRLRRGAIPHELRLVDHIVSPDVERRERRRFVLEQIGELHQSHRDILLLYYFGGASLREAATALETSEAAAKKRLQRARAELGKQIVHSLDEELRAPAQEENERRLRKTMGAVLLVTPGWQPVPEPAAPDAAAAPVPPQSPLPLDAPRIVNWGNVPFRIVACGIAGLALLGLGVAVWPAANDSAEPHASAAIENHESLGTLSGATTATSDRRPSGRRPDETSAAPAPSTQASFGGGGTLPAGGRAARSAQRDEGPALGVPSSPGPETPANVQGPANQGWVARGGPRYSAGARVGPQARRMRQASPKRETAMPLPPGRAPESTSPEPAGIEVRIYSLAPPR